MQLFSIVFLPTQQSLTEPGPEPAHAILNFHAIASLVLEAFEQFEIGGEQGHGYDVHGGNSTPRKGSPCSNSEAKRTRSATEANTDDMFFAVIDRWRAGIDSGKKSLKLIRGCQEFCDMALNVIHYVKEHRLLQPKPRKRKERSDKRVIRRPRNGVKEMERPKAAVKRKLDAVEEKAAANKVDKVEPRKKAKAKSNGAMVTNRQTKWVE